MSIVVIVVGMGIIFLGFLLTSPEHFLYKDPKKIEKSEIESVFVVGETLTIGSFVNAAKASGILVGQSPISVLPETRFPKIVLALGDNPMDNLLLCAQAKRKDPVCRTFALCQNPQFEKFFRTEKVDRVFFEMPSIEKFLRVIGMEEAL